MESDVTKAKDKKELCGICYSENPDRIILNCGHSGICKLCGDRLISESKPCPWCKKNIQKIIKCFVMTNRNE